jgi:hypothetical protein
MDTDTPANMSDGPIQTQIARLVTLAEQAEAGFRRDNALDKVSQLVDSDAAHLLARAELVRALTEANTLGVSIDPFALTAKPSDPWWSNPWAVWAATTCLVAVLATIAVIAIAIT